MIEFLIDNWYYYEALLGFLLYVLAASLFCLRMDARGRVNDQKVNVEQMLARGFRNVNTTLEIGYDIPNKKNR